MSNQKTFTETTSLNTDSRYWCEYIQLLAPWWKRWIAPYDKGWMLKMHDKRTGQTFSTEVSPVSPTPSRVLDAHQSLYNSVVFVESSEVLRHPRFWQVKTLLQTGSSVEAVVKRTGMAKELVVKIEKEWS